MNLETDFEYLSIYSLSICQVQGDLSLRGVAAESHSAGLMMPSTGHKRNTSRKGFTMVFLLAI